MREALGLWEGKREETGGLGSEVTAVGWEDCTFFKMKLLKNPNPSGSVRAPL